MKPTIITLSPRQNSSNTVRVATFEEAFGDFSEARGRKSTGQGINMLRNIYDIYNPANQDHFSYTYDDLINPVTKAATGTRVTIHIPKQYKIQLS